MIRIEGDLEGLLQGTHVRHAARRLGYEPLIDQFMREVVYCSQDGIEGILSQFGKAYNSWSLWIDGGPIVHLRVRRPFDGTIVLLDARTHGAVVDHWEHPSDVRRWFQARRGSAKVAELMRLRAEAMR